jgi:hypothetical protein
VAPLLAAAELRSKSKGSAQKKWPAQWFLGLTTKAVQNVLRGRDGDRIDGYVGEYQRALTEAAAECEALYGNAQVTISARFENKVRTYDLDWSGLSLILSAVGAQTLTVRGSEKSTYGKLFERLVLGGVLRVLGFKYTAPDATQHKNKIFWLTDSSETREADATAIIRPGTLARFDIGFIGNGNPEITKDKLSRFERTKEVEGEHHSSRTFVIVDTVPETTKTLAQAKSSGARIVQMSMKMWPYELSRALQAECRYSSPLLRLPESHFARFVREKLRSYDFTVFAAASDSNSPSEDKQ